MTPRIRNTAATRRFSQNVKDIVAALRKGEMTTADISDLLDYSPSGVRKYIYHLVDEGVIAPVRDTIRLAQSLHYAVYRLTASGERLVEFLAAHDAWIAGKVAPKLKRARPPAENGVHRYSCGHDDMMVREKLKFEGRHLDVHEALFGRAA